MKWFERKFELGIPSEMLPNIIERLRGTPARVEERLRDLPLAQLTQRFGDAWSLQEQAGHLLDLEELWFGRVKDFQSGVTTLRAADLQNTKTHTANHNERDLGSILHEFRAERKKMIAALENCDQALLQRTALHPRLQQPMRLVDHAFFVAEHDDHHLAVITQLLNRHD